MDDGLRAEQRRRVDKDQAARLRRDSDAMSEVDWENLPWLKGLIADRGWPGASLVGTNGAHDAWLLVQHMDADPSFQRQCLDLLTAAVAAGVEARRAAAELEPLTDYLHRFDDYPVQSSQLKCPGCDRWVPFEPPDEGATVTVSCPGCGLETTIGSGS